MLEEKDLTLLEEKELVYVGTMRKGERFQKNFPKYRTEISYSSVFGFSKKLILVTFCPKKNKTVFATSVV